jgi:GNAT superfamily N-acetyltransferase
MKEMEEIYIRLADLADLPILYEFEQGIIKAERPYDEMLKSGHINYYDLAAMIESTESEVLVAVFKAEIIGSAYLTIKQAKPYLKHIYFAYLGFMYVKPEYRGKGVIKIIIEEIKKMAQAKNVNELHLDVYNDNHSAIRAYEKAGFKRNLINMRIEI